MPTRIAALLLASATGLALLAPPAQAAPARRISYTAWDSTTRLAQGTTSGTEVTDGVIRLSTPAGVSGGQEFGRWTSPWRDLAFGFTELIASWEARTPRATSVVVEVRGRDAAGRTSSWDTLGTWARDDTHLRRTSSGPQTDDLASVAYDTWESHDSDGLTSFQLRVTLRRPQGARAVPTVDVIGAVASRLPSTSDVSTSTPNKKSGALGTVLDVPRYSQMAHAGTYPEYDGGGAAWCSPTSLTMVLDYLGALPRPSSYAWVKDGHPDPVVVQVARQVYDVGLGGAGNWPFNTAYAATRVGTDATEGGGGAFVTRLRSLRQVELFIAAGLPVITSVRFGPGRLSGAPINSTNGHLMVVVGFTEDGDVVVNDPASPTRSGVRRTYDRGQFEDAWITRSGSAGSGGIAYLVHDATRPLPGHATNW